MEPPLDYSNYTPAQLQDALAHIKRDKYPDNFAALVEEIERRKTLPPPIAPSSPIDTSPPLAEPNGGGRAGEPLVFSFWRGVAGGLFGAFVGFLAGFVVSLSLAFLLFSSTLPFRDGFDYFLIGLLFFCVALGGYLGFMRGAKS